MKFKYGRAWAIDGSFYTEDKKTIESFLTGLYIPGKMITRLQTKTATRLPLFKLIID